MTRPSLQDAPRAAGGRVAAAQDGCDRCNRGASPDTRASRRYGHRPRPVAHGPDWRGSRGRPRASSVASVAGAHADRLPGRNKAAVEPAHAAGRPGRRPRTADTPWMVSAHKKRGAWATRSIDDNHADVHRDPAGRKEISGSTFMSTSGSVPESAEATAVRPHCAAWYYKSQPTFSDALAAVRRVLWTPQDFCGSRHRTERVEIPALLLKRFVETLCLAA